MAIDKLPASAEFFKQLSHEYQQLRFIIQVQENFAVGALLHGFKLESHYLLSILEQLDILISKAQQLRDEVEKQVWTSKS